MLSARATAALFCAVVVLAGAMEEESGMTSLSEGQLAEEMDLGMGGMNELGEGACRPEHVWCAYRSLGPAMARPLRHPWAGRWRRCAGAHGAVYRRQPTKGRWKVAPGPDSPIN